MLNIEENFSCQNDEADNLYIHYGKERCYFPLERYFKDLNNQRRDITFPTFVNKTNEKDKSKERLGFFIESYLKKVLSNFQEGTVVDLGTGDGGLSHGIASLMKGLFREVNYEGIDRSKKFVFSTNRALKGLDLKSHKIFAGDIFGQEITHLSNQPDVLIASQIVTYSPDIQNFISTVLAKKSTITFIIGQPDFSFLNKINAEYAGQHKQSNTEKKVKREIDKDSNISYEIFHYDSFINFTSIVQKKELLKISRAPYIELKDEQKETRNLLEFIAGSPLEYIESKGDLESYIEEIVKHLSENGDKVIFWNYLLMIVQNSNENNSCILRWVMNLFCPNKRPLEKVTDEYNNSDIVENSQLVAADECNPAALRSVIGSAESDNDLEDLYLKTGSKSEEPCIEAFKIALPQGSKKLIYNTIKDSDSEVVVDHFTLCGAQEMAFYMMFDPEIDSKKSEDIYESILANPNLANDCRTICMAKINYHSLKYQKENYVEAYEYAFQIYKEYESNQDMCYCLLDHPFILYNLAVMNYYGQGNQSNQSNLTAFFEFMNEATKLGYKNAEYHLANMYFKGEGVTQNYKKAFEYWDNLAGIGDSDAETNLCYLYYNGLGVEKNTDRAINYCKKAALKNNVQAQYYLGKIYYVNKDYENSFHFFEKASSNCHMLSDYNIAYMYLVGQGVDINLSKAEFFYKRAAKLGYPKAQNTLGLLYKDTGDDDKALYWFIQAANQGHTNAKKSLGTILSGYDGGFIEKLPSYHLPQDIELHNIFGDCNNNQNYD